MTTLHMPTTPDWRNIFALGMIWHRLEKNRGIIWDCQYHLEAAIDAIPQPEQPMTAAEYRDYWREEEVTTGREI
jgi:hypothetical protein